MRDILFRGKRIDNGKWIEGSLIQMDKESSQCFIFPFCDKASSLSCDNLVASRMVAVDKTTIGQFTGILKSPSMNMV